MLHYLVLAAALVPAQSGPEEAPPGGAPDPAARVVQVAAQATEPGPKPIEVAAPALPPTAAPAPATEAPPAAPTPPDRWALMRSLQGTWPGSLLDDNRLSLYGWVNASATASSATGNHSPMVWNDFANEFLLQQAWARFERPVVTSGTTEPTFGFRTDWLFGSDYRFTLPRGIFNGQLTGNDGGPNRYGVDPVAFYASAYFPTILQGTEVRLGRHYTPFGVESLEAISTPTVSRSYAFNWCPPFTHFGLQVNTTINPHWATTLMLVNGNDVFLDPAQELRFVGKVQWTPSTHRDVVALGASLGRGKFNDQEGQNHINVVDLVWTHVFSSRLSYALEVIYGWQYNAPQPGELEPTFDERGAPVVDETGALVTQPSIGMAHWGSVVNYLFYTFNPRLTGMFRLEFFDDFEGSRTGFEGLYTAATVGLTFKPTKSLWVRPELRFDYNHESQPFDGKNWLATASVDVILRW